MSDAHAGRPPRKQRRILETLPAADDVREEVRRTSRQMKLLMELLGLCERAQAGRPTSQSPSAPD